MENKPKRKQYEFDKRKYDHVHLQVPKGRKADIQAAAKAANESLNEYVNNAIQARMGWPTWRNDIVDEWNDD